MHEMILGLFPQSNGSFMRIEPESPPDHIRSGGLSGRKKKGGNNAKHCVVVYLYIISALWFAVFLYGLIIAAVFLFLNKQTLRQHTQNDLFSREPQMIPHKSNIPDHMIRDTLLRMEMVYIYAPCYVHTVLYTLIAGACLCIIGNYFLGW